MSINGQAVSPGPAAELKPKKPPLEPVPLRPLSEHPKVSIIVPSYNQGQFIRATIDSILSQSHRPLEIRVIDGGSTDQTVDVLKSYGSIPELHWVSEKDRGVVHAVNKGFAAVTGEIVGIQSSDDTYLPNALSIVVEQFRQRPATGLIYGDTVKIDADGHEVGKHLIGPYSLENIFLMKSWIPQPSALFRREMLQACGGWDESIPYAPDTDLWIRMAFRTEVIKLDEYLSQRRIHGAQRDTQAAKIFRDYSKMIDQSPDLAQAPVRLQRIAQAGKHLMGVRYNASGSDWYAARQILSAGLCYPPAFNLQQFLHFMTLPAWRAGSRVKRWLLRRPEPKAP